jgi:hypothetical protein
MGLCHLYSELFSKCKLYVYQAEKDRVVFQDSSDAMPSSITMFIQFQGRVLHLLSTLNINTRFMSVDRASFSNS